MVLPQFAHYRSPGFKFCFNATENHRNLVLNGGWFWSDWGFWRVFRRACLLQGWQRWGASSLTLLVLTSDLRKLILLVSYGMMVYNKNVKQGIEV